MRIAVLLAATAVLTGCSTGVVGTARTAPPLTPIGVPGTSALPRPIAPVAAPSTPPVPATPPARPGGAAPGPGTGIAEVIAWVRAGSPADASGFHTATRGGQRTDLGQAVAFVVGPSGTGAPPIANCMTNPFAGDALACLVALTDPPARPADVQTGWKANWVDVTRAGVDVGSPHGDPGPFVTGTGHTLAVGSTLAFGDYLCRAGTAAVVCIDTAPDGSAPSAVRLAADGVTGYGCLQPAAPAPGIGVSLRC